MTSTTAAENLPGHSVQKEKEKVEKRRALGRGLESLLPGPRVVAGTATRPAAAPAAGLGGDTSTVTAELRSAGPFDSAAPSSATPLRAGSFGSAQGRQPGAAVPTSPPSAKEAVVSASALPQPEPIVVPMIQAVAEEELDEVARASRPHEPAADEAAELRSASPGHRPGPTQAEESITILAQAESRVPGNLVVNLAIENIDKNPFQTRYVEKDDALEELTNSIKANGVLQPILVRPAEEEGRYILILGERRLHASKVAGKTTVPAMVRRVSEQQAAEMTIIENLQREDLSPLEQAEAFRMLSEEFKLTQAQIGDRVGLSRESVSNYMRLLRLPREVMQLLAEKKIKFAEAKELLKLEDNDKITQAALYAVKKGYTVEQVEKLVLQMSGWLDSFSGMPGQERKKSGARWVDPNVRAAQFELERLLGVRVRIRDRKGKGKIVIEYSTVDDYERVVDALRGKK